MNMVTKKTIFKRYEKEYYSADKQRRKEILDHIVDVIQIHRKSAIRRFSASRKQKSNKSNKGRPVYYTADVIAALYTVWDAANEPCGELMHPMIKEYVSIMQRDSQWDHSPDATNKLLEMSEHTVRRKIAKFIKIKVSRKGKSSTKPSHLKHIIPIFKGPWNDLPPGHGQLDTVAHCGDTLIGDYAHTVSYIDAATYWSIHRGQWNKGQHVTVESMKYIKVKMPFDWLSGHPDTGSEFINWVAKKWFDEQKIELTRSEPGKKNDNMYIEERNGHVVRKYLGYFRFDNPDHIKLINQIYELLNIYLNHFQSVRRTLETKRIGSKRKRTYEKKAKTPYQRVLDHPKITQSIKDKLMSEHNKLNPLNLKNDIDKLIEKLILLQKGSTVLDSSS